MRMLSAILVALFAFFFKVVRCGDSVHNVPWAKRHSRVALSDGAGVARQNFTNVEKRFDGVRLTFFTTGLGACGATNVESDFVSLLVFECQVGHSIVVINYRSLPSTLP